MSLNGSNKISKWFTQEDVIFETELSILGGEDVFVAPHKFKGSHLVLMARISLRSGKHWGCVSVRGWRTNLSEIYRGQGTSPQELTATAILVWEHWWLEITPCWHLHVGVYWFVPLHVCVIDFKLHLASLSLYSIFLYFCLHLSLGLFHIFSGHLSDHTLDCEEG